MSARSILSQIEELRAELREVRATIDADGDIVDPERTHLAERLQRWLRDPMGDPLAWSPLHDQWCWHIEDAWARGLNAAILGPIGHGKTTVCVVGVQGDAIGLNVEHRGVIVSAAEAIAQERLGAIADNIENNAHYRECYGNVLPDYSEWSKTKARVKRRAFHPDPTLRAAGIRARRAGARADLINFDDCEDIDSLSGAVRRGRSDAFWAVWMKRLDKAESRALWTCTTWHQEDLNHVLPRTVGWATLVQAVDPKFGGIEWARVVNDGDRRVA